MNTVSQIAAINAPRNIHDGIRPIDHSGAVLPINGFLLVTVLRRPWRVATSRIP
jgi:hypothetical protein